MPQFPASKVLECCCVHLLLTVVYADGDGGSAETLPWDRKTNCQTSLLLPTRGFHVTSCTIMEPGLRIALVVLGVVDISFSLSLISIPFLSGSIFPVV